MSQKAKNTGLKGATSRWEKVYDPRLGPGATIRLARPRRWTYVLVVQGHDINTKRQVIKREILIVPFIKLKQLPVNLINWNGTFSLVLCVGIFFTHLTNELYHRIALRRVFVQITEGAL